MINRVKQLFSALTASISTADKEFVARHLTAEEQSLFWQMNLPDQRHALNVTYSAQSMAKELFEIDQTVLLKCALLHDIGKVRGDVSTIDKVITVLAHSCCKSWAERWGRLGRGSRLQNLRHAFFIYFRHGERSAEFLTNIHADQRIVEIVRQHHKAPADNDPPELTVLRKADNLH